MEQLVEKERIENLSDEVLVSFAKRGDQEAFGELVARSRHKALGLAKKILRDDHLAEDIVQEGLLRAFLKMGELNDHQRFQSWFQTIIRNEALMKLRKGEMKREQAFSNYSKDGGLLDTIDHLIKVSEHHTYNDPAKLFANKEMLLGLRHLLTCLSEKEKRIFEAFFFEQLTPEEIAALFQISTSNVHNTIYKARNKVRRERIRVHMNDFVHKRREEGRPVRKILRTPQNFKE